MSLHWFLGERQRPLTAAEFDLAFTVFGRSLPYAAVRVGDQTMPGGTRWAECTWNCRYVLHLGPAGYADATADAAVLVHELVHVWQGYHGVIPWAYMARSLWCQLVARARHGDRGAAYRYQPGLPWNCYNVEQQASLVEDWYAYGMSEEDPRYGYVRDEIRRPVPSVRVN